MSRTRAWVFVEQEAKRLAALGLTPREIAGKLGVNKSSVTRWIAAGKLTVTPKPSIPTSATIRQSPLEWAASVRDAYQLDPTDDQLVTLGEQALALSLDEQVSVAGRMAASTRFQAIVRQLALPMRGSEAQQPAETPAESPAEAPKRPVVQRSSADPRGILTAVPAAVAQ